MLRARGEHWKPWQTFKELDENRVILSKLLAIKTCKVWNLVRVLLQLVSHEFKLWKMSLGEMSTHTGTYECHYLYGYLAMPVIVVIHRCCSWIQLFRTICLVFSRTMKVRPQENFNHIQLEPFEFFVLSMCYIQKEGPIFNRRRQLYLHEYYPLFWESFLITLNNSLNGGISWLLPNIFIAYGSFQGALIARAA